MRRNSILFLLFIIAFSSFIFAENTYYVDSSNGNDSNNGLSPESAWKTISYVNNNWWQLMPGDNLLFKRGTIYTDDSLWLKKGGTSSNYMVIGAYGSGKNPVLKNAQGGIICGEANIGYIQIQDLIIQDTHGTSNGITFNRDGVSKVIISRLEISNCGNNGIFLRTIDTYTIEECSISNCGNAGIVIYGSSTYPIKNGIIRNNKIHDIKSNDGITLHRDDNGNDIGPSHQIINNVLYDCAEQGLDLTSGYHIVARGNETYGNMVGGIAIGWDVNDVWIDKHYSHDEKKMGIIVEKSSNVKITSSIIFNAAYHSLTINECQNFEAYNNTIAYGPDSKGSILDISPGSQNISFKNNIFTCTQSSNPGCYVRYLQGTTPQNTNSQFDHNIWWQVSGSDYGLFYDESRGRYSFSGWLSYYNQDVNSQFIDPQLENQDSRNFRLLPSSPGIDSGTDVGLSNDFEGNIIPQWSGPDIGAYEYASTPSLSPLSASIIASPITGNAPLTVDFTGSASGGTSPYSYHWSFGDGQSSDNQSPSHTYADAGDFTAKLTVTDKAGREAIESVTIKVEQAPSPLTASVSASPSSGEAPLTVSFTCSVGGGISPYSYTWNFGDGASSNSHNPTHTYSSAGDYTAELRVTDNAGTKASATFSIKVNQAQAPLKVTATASPASGQAPLNVSFSASATGGTSPYSYTWNFGDGGTSTSQNLSHTFSSAGDFTAVLTVTDNKGQKDNASVAIKVTPAPDPLKATASASPTYGQAPLTVNFAGEATGGTAPYSFGWSFGDGQTSNSQNPTHAYGKASTYTATLTVKDSGSRKDTATVSITVSAAPTPLKASFIASPTSGKAPLAVSFTGNATGGKAPYSYKWDFGDGSSSTAQNPSHTYTETKDFRITFTVKDSEGSQDSAILTIQVTAAPQSLDGTATASPTSGQSPLNVGFSASASGGTSPYSYTWNFGDGNTSTAQNPSHVYSSAGDFTAVLTVTDSANQKDDASITIKVTPAPDPLKATASASPTSGQAPLKVSFAGNVTGGTTPYSVRWNFSDGKTSSDQNPSHTFTEAKDYTVTLTVTDKNGQQDSSSVSIGVSAKPTPLKASFIASPTSGKAPLTVSFTGNATGGKAPYSYKWDFGDGSSSTAQKPTHTYTEAKDFRVTFTVKDSDGSQDSATLTIQVTAAPPSLDVTATASPTSGQAPLNVSFSASVNGGTPPYMYIWNFGDGHTSNIQNPSHEFSSSGDFNVTLRVSDSGASAGDSSAQAVTSVMINVGDADKPADFDCVPRHLLFGISVSNGKVVKQSFNIIKSGSGKLDWTVADDAEWVTCLPSSGYDSGEVTVRVDSSSLSPGIYSSTISVFSPQAAQSPKYVTVKLKLTDDDKLPLGSFDTPVDGAMVSGNIPLAGWALDDIKLDRVEIKRNACPEDSPEVIDSDGLVLIGHVVFVKGARPDIELLYPDYPNSNLAGWGCMLPTFRLPQRGNGYFTIYALAFDTSGQRALLGQKLIFADNGNRKKPFGSLETPKQGETVLGDPYVISGWALTPPPKEIPRDGFTIGVYVDGILTGHPVYNQGHVDIASSFPEYRNSDGPVGSFAIDTSRFKKGMHLIEWYVEDSDGEGDVIDSRFFEIKNGKTETSSFSVAIVNRYTEDTRGVLTISIDGSPVIEVPELSRIELQLNAKGGSKFLGWGEDMSRDLPIGSTLDSLTGTFVWSLGPGFIGEHILHFAVAEGWTISKPLKITVRILPKQEFWRRGVQDGPRGSQGRNSYSP